MIKKETTGEQEHPNATLTESQIPIIPGVS